ncbi:MAG: clostripain-related cysteine peptidase, partial [Candidatus Thermoplasmatota archaeon]
GIEDFNEMETIGSTDKINIVVQIDRIEGNDSSNGDWIDTRRYYITKDEDNKTITSQLVENIGEANMGNPETLSKFINWSIRNYPAKYYALFIWDHGGGFYGVAWDDTDKDYLDMKNLSQGLGFLREKKIDIIGFDACLMGMIEVFYQIREYGKIGIGSEPMEPGDGWPYENILKKLASNPAMIPNEFAKEIVYAYVDSYSDGKDDPNDSPAVTMSAYSLDKIDSVTEYMDEFFMRLSLVIGKPFYNTLLREARSRTIGFDPGHIVFLDIANYPNYDLYDLVNNIIHPTYGPLIPSMIDKKIKESGEALLASLNEALIANKNGVKYYNAHGVAIYFPSGNLSIEPGPRTNYDIRYDATDFAEDLFWNELLHYYHDLHSAENTPPTLKITSPSNFEKIKLKNGKLKIEGKAFDVEKVEKVFVKINEGKWLEAKGTEKWEYKLEKKIGVHRIYAKASDGSLESTIDEIEINIVGEEKKENFLPYILGSCTAIVIFIFICSYFYYKKYKTVQ